MKNKQWLLYCDLLKRYIKPYKNKLIVFYIITILENVIGLLPIYFMGNIINYVNAQMFDRILYIICMLCFIFLITSTLSMGEAYLSNWLNNEISKRIKEDIYSKATNISIDKFQEISSGHIISLIEGDSLKIADFFSSKIIGILVAIVTLIVSLFFLFKLSFSLTIIAIMSFPLGFIGNLFCGNKIAKKSEILRKTSDENYMFMNKTFSGIKEVKAYVIEQKMIQKFKAYTRQIQKNNMKIVILEIICDMFNAIVSSIADWIIIGYGTWRIIEGSFSIGSYVAFNGYSSSLFNSIKELLNINIIFKTIEISLKRIGMFLGVSDEKTGRSINKNCFSGDIQFNNVSFYYKVDSEKVLHNFCVTFKSKEISVLVGENGVGKSTVFSLIEQFYQPREGDIFIGNTNLRNIDLECLRNNIGMVQQHPMMLSGTLRENLVYGNENVNEKTLDRVCEKVGLIEFVNSLPDRYATQLDEISGGEQQRIAIARALIKDPPILLLDEVTSDLDGKSEIEIMDLLEKLAGEKTIILISHRVNAIIRVPNIYVMDQGRIVGQGNHKELSENCFLYSKLVNSN